MKSIKKEFKKFVNILPYNRPEDDSIPLVTEQDLVYIDQSPAEKFNINEAGWIRNDISAFELAETENIAHDILSRFEEIKNEDLYKDMTEDEMFKAVLSRRATTDPVLFARALEVYTKVQYKKLKDEADKQKEKEFSEREIEEAKKDLTKQANETKDSSNNSEGAEVSASSS